MTHADAQFHIDYLQQIGFKHGLIADGWLMKDGVWITNFQAGPVMVEALSHEAAPVNPEYAIFYSSWDGRRRKDVSNLSEEEFVDYMRSQPKGVIRSLKAASSET